MSRLTDVLVGRGLVAPETLARAQAAHERNGRGLVQTLLDDGTVSEQAMLATLAEQAGMPFVDLDAEPVDPETANLLPDYVCRRHTILPIGHDGDTVLIATADPGNVLALDDAKALLAVSVSPVLATPTALRNAISRYLRSDTEIAGIAHSLGAAAAGDELDLSRVGDSVAADSPVVRYVDLLVRQAISDRASDIHIEPTEHDVRVRYRIDGVLHETQRAPRQISGGVISRVKILADVDIAEKRKPQDGRMSVVHDGKKVDLRVATLPTVWGEKVVMRILDNSTTSLDVRDLALLDENFEKYHAAYSKPYGMILVTGPTGSGKSTTLYATINAVSRPEINVITVEDPVEYRLPGINQVQVNPKAGLTFASALRAILRSDPDVVLLGEVRDHETAQIAIESALTGHLVLSTLHTNDAPSAVTRLVEMGIEPYLVGSALDCVVAQRLARRLCERCRAPHTPTREELRAARYPGSDDDPIPELYRPVGCVACSGTGYRGRVALHEVMPVTEEIEWLAADRASAGTIARTALSQGMVTLHVDGWRKAASGVTSVEEILRVIA
ncbi:GspE/PulE family protein [Xylanimonas ulmi]|uniref:Type IV pilus assembly protein PilB n=1 Tax=Xylanimonas ulmi TaxID=228973 RepID=A0A4Q7M640_9MICO|nr:ATPase, T2SS/T4P/T4SS family [Xylanibacterium ulmi]RZS61519.1 type IV pilus assembly protein PilB [Xylanibacterium ulmi]